MTAEYTTFVTEFGGNYTTWATCSNCKQAVQYPTERPYNVCPYCGKRVRYKEET